MAVSYTHLDVYKRQDMSERHLPDDQSSTIDPYLITSVRQTLAEQGACLLYTSGLLQVRLPERMRLWSVSGGSACSTPGKCSGESYRRGLRGRCV